MTDRSFGLALLGIVSVCGGIVCVRFGGGFTGGGSLGKAGVVAVVALAAVLLVGAGRRLVSGPGGGTGRSGGNVKDTARWSTAVHEASHVVAVKRAGGSASGWVSGDGRRGSYSGSLPDRAGAVQEAVVHLAGGIGQRKLVGRDGPSSSDLAQARAVLRGTGVSLAAARSRAAALVGANRRAILAEAKRLHG